jgi:uncharacterized protein YuzE
MKIEYDPKHDIMNIQFIADVLISESLELEGGIIIDYTQDKEIASIEIMGAKKRVPREALDQINFVIVRDKLEV